MEFWARSQALSLYWVRIARIEKKHDSCDKLIKNKNELIGEKPLSLGTGGK
jgi:hypothetical protein